MMDPLAFIFLFGFVIHISCVDTCNDGMNILLPKVIVPGQSTTVLVHFYNKEVQHNVTLRLIRPQDDNSHTAILAQNTVPVKDNGVIWLSVPSQENGIYEIQTLLDCTPSDENCTLQTSSKVKLSGSVRDVIIRPSSNYYRPGERITFWILAIDQILHAPKSALAKIYVKDPNGVSLAFWEDVPLFEGTKEFKMPISERALLGKWTIEVRTEGNIYTSELNVSLARGSNELPNREQVVTEKHFVELHFSNEMRRKYKPGLPLMGKIEAVSSEEEVRVRVKAIDDQLTVLYSQDIDMNGREGMFFVPAVITNTDDITVQAELISLDGKDVDSQYVLARETLSKWHSESNCYLLIRDLHADLKPDTDAQVTVLTSCPCNGDVHYVVTTEGKMVSWGELTLSNQTNISIILDSIMQGVNIYEFNISFAIEAEMAPTSHLLVYYTTETGEIIGDSISFNVKLLHEKISLILDENNVWYVGEKIKVGILSFPKTHICLVGGRAEDIYIENRNNIDSEEQILEDGMSFLTSCKRKENNFVFPKHESYFPNTIINQVWLWKCFNYTEEIETNGVSLPPTNGPGKWKLWAFSLSDTIELRISDPVTINVFSPVNIQFELPTAVKVMEIIQVEITISSNINACIDIHALIALSEGAVYPGIDMSIVSEKLRLGGHGATSIVVRIQPISPGLKTMTANVSCYVRNKCEEPALSGDEEGVKIPITNIITHSEKLEAVPEGIQRLHTESAYFCANEEVLSLSPTDVNYKFVSAPRKKYNVIFDVIAEKNFRIALSEYENSTKNIYQIYLGDFDNTVSWVGRGKRNYEVHLSNAQTPNLLSPTKYTTFWLSWENAVINIGNGSVIGRNTFLTHIMDRKIRVNFIGFATSWSVEGRVRISEYNDESGYSQVLRLGVPRNIIADSEKGNLYVTSGLSLPLVFQNLRIKSNTYPFSSLANVLSSFTTILMMDETSWDKEWLYSKYNKTYVYEVTEKNIQTLFSYMNDDFSFSDHPKIFDYLSTVRAFEILSHAQYFWKIDSRLIDNIKQRIRKNQQNDGSFSNFSNSSIGENIAVTAESIVIFLETGIDNTDNEMIQRGQMYLENSIRNINDSYTIAVACYALTLLKNNIAEDFIDQIRISTRNDDGENEWQNSSPLSISFPFEWPYEKEKVMSDEEKKNLIAGYISDYKASAYAALIHIYRKDLKRVEPIIKYIYHKSSILDQYPEVSFLVAKALTKFASASRDVHPSLTISLATSGMELTDTLELRSEYAAHTLDLPSLPTKVFIYATGAGCSTVQSQVTYLSYETATANSFDFISFIEEEIPAHYNIVGDPEGLYPQLIVKSCFKLDNHSKGVRIEAILFSGYKFDSILSISPKNIDMIHGFAGDKLWFMFANVTANCGICVRYLIQSSFIISSLRPMFFRMYDIENSHIMQELFVHSTNKDSLLRTDVTSEDFTVWFGSQNERTDNLNDISYFYRCETRTQQLENILLNQSNIENDQFENNKTIVADINNLIDEQNMSSTVFTPATITEKSTKLIEIISVNNTSFETTVSFKEPESTIDYSSSVSSAYHAETSSHSLPSSSELVETGTTIEFPHQPIVAKSNLIPNRIHNVNDLENYSNTNPKQIHDKNSNKIIKKKNENIFKSSSPSPLINTEVVTIDFLKKFTDKKEITDVNIDPKISNDEKKSGESELKIKMNNSNALDESIHSNLTTVATTVAENIIQMSSSTKIPTTITDRAKDPKKNVDSKTELVFELHNDTTTSTPTSDRTKKDKIEKGTTTSILWDMLKEVAYDTKRKRILKS